MEVVRYMDLEEFARAAQGEEGTFAIVGAGRRDLEWAVERLRDLGGVELVSMSSGIVRWGSGSLAHLVSSAEHLRGVRLDGALVVYGDPATPIPYHVLKLLDTCGRGPVFPRWTVRW